MRPALSLILGTTLFATFAGIMSAQAGRDKTPRTGEVVYRQQCASCHGAKGEGTKHYQKPLVGNQSVNELARFISQSMPPGPRKCSVPDSQKVAAFIYNSFYSPVAQARNRPPRVELSRLTVRQYRNAVADLIGSFRPPVRLPAERGLRGEYFKSRNLSPNERILQRVDPEIHFDFGTETPTKAAFDPHQFSMRWRGSVLAQETGEYEFIVRTEHATQLTINDAKTPLIDAWVKSGNENEYRASVFLLGGRAYPLELEFSKAKQGVDDSATLKGKPPVKASLTLAWKPPKRAVEVIPQRCLLPEAAPKTFVLTTPFPPDDRSMGYERGSSISKAWDDATTEAALETAGYVAENLAELSGAADNAADRKERVRAFCRAFVQRAFRQPLSEADETFYVGRQFDSAPDLETAVKRVVILTLKSPQFLYREIGATAQDPYNVASRLSFGLWDSLPDDALIQAASRNELATREQVYAQAERMLADPRAWFKLREFLLQWLKVDLYPDLTKNPKRYPGFDEEVASDLRASLELFLEQVVWNERSDFRELMLTNKLALNGRLAKFYGINLPPDAPFQTVTVSAKERVGILTHPYLLASFAYLDASSPIHRGVLLARSFLGRTLLPPPEAVAPVAADLHPKLTTRQRVALQTKPAACMSCHALINPLGYTLERYDAIGRLRDQDNGSPVDSTGSYLARNGKVIKFNDVRDLARFLTESEEAQTAFTEKLFQYMIKQPIRAFGPRASAELRRTFETNGFNIRKQMAEIMAVSALVTVK
jgi:cytochrome c553